MSKNFLQARVLILPKASLRDPQGEAIHKTLQHIGFGENLSGVAKGSLVVLTFSDEIEKEAAAQQVAQMCEQLLVNQLIERFEVEWIS